MKRNILVDRLRGYACFLVLFGHVIMGVRVAGVNIPEFFRGMEAFIWSFHVALFLFLSGVVYKETGEWKGKKTRWGFILHKLYNLGVPYIVFSVVYILINSLVGEANTEFSVSDILNIWKSPVAQYWFLYVLFFLFCLWTALSGVLKNLYITIVAVVIGYSLPFLGISLGYIDMVFYLALVFGIGTFVDFQKLARPPIWVRWGIVLIHLVTGVIFVLLDMTGAPFVKEMLMLLGIYSSIMLISILQSSKLIARFLDFMNRYSFQIYLLHTIFTAGVRVLLIRFGVTWWWTHVVLGTIVGIAFSVIAAKLAEKSVFLNFFFFPAKTVKKIKERL